MKHRVLQVVLLMALVGPVALLAQGSRSTPSCAADNGGLTLPGGFCALVVANETGPARHLAVAANGDIYVALRNAPNQPGGVLALRDTNGDGQADVREKFGDSGGTGLLLRNGYLYLSRDDAVVRFPMKAGQLLPAGPAETVVGGFPQQPIHPTKTLAFDDRGGLYVNVGLRANACTDPDQGKVPGLNPCSYLENGGGVWRFDANKTGQDFSRDGKRFSTGLRQTNSMAWHPTARALYLVQHGRNGLNRWTQYYTAELNAESPAEEFQRITEGVNYGFPYCYHDPQQKKRVIAPEYGGDGKNVGDCARYPAPVVAYPAHWAPNDLLFYTGSQFERKYSGGAFIAFHGGVSRTPLPQGGYKVVFQPMRDGKASGAYETFADGFAGKPVVMTREEAASRPMGLAQGPDGSLYISDSVKGKIWRVIYRGPASLYELSLRYGTWASPLSAAAVAGAGLRLSAVHVDGDDIYWLEGRPQEGGRSVLVRCRPDGSITDLTPSDFNVRTRVHEYGGGAFIVRNGIVHCANFSDQRVYRVSSGSRPEALTPAGCFYADFEFDPHRQRLICVREDHTRGDREPINTLVGLSLATLPNIDAATSAGVVLTSGADFYSTPRLSPDGSRLAWLSWRHPAMPWDGTELWVADVDESGALADAQRVAGGENESIYQPGWSPDGTLYFVSDSDGWWKLYRSDRSIAAVIQNAPVDAEFGRPEWVFGTATWRCAGESRLVVSYTREGRWHLGVVDVATGILTDLAPDVQPHDWIAANSTHVVIVGGFDTEPDAVVRIELATGRLQTLRPASSLSLDSEDVSVAEPIVFPTTGGRTAHAFFYPPRNGSFRAPEDEAPPLIVITHGGPTAAAHPTFDIYIQYWTTRGFAVVDVNYGGSSGYGRAYRERLNGQWGIVDVADAIAAARFLSDTGRADPARLIIRGGSAGGYTTLAALTFHPEVFKAGASYYGISDLEVLEVDTHKFESHYSHSLIGPYPEAKAVYRARSPIHAIDRLACPLILLQGLEDKVVPPNQSAMMADAVRAKGLPVAYLAFEGEQHGFRKAATIIRSLEAELYFYGKVFGFTPADRIEPVPIDNLRALPE